MIDTTLSSDNSLPFRKTLLERIQKLTMEIDDKIREKIFLYDIDRETAKILALSPGKNDKFEFSQEMKYSLLSKVEWENMLSLLNHV